ncbi:hypothetical protein FK498_00855 [Elioraea sp. Yellowstone]|uniref:hypothetical protein n=1 Tax=unclassified Elioraea TaxID=2619524 RepID=UPI00114F3033|nr:MULTISPECIES: hypothetical protein [unclassified Elioraea]TQF85265.1 hypothetical protein FK498_00855 [Elioraea sp. Yellowstone]GIX11564.1 MAG: hypothetical protein KatS3mg116_3274 [Elioraea sp.]
MTLDELLRDLDLLGDPVQLPPLLRQLALRGLVSVLSDLVPAQGEMVFADEAADLAQRGEALIRAAEESRRRGDQLICLAALMTRLR